ncbi:hypothetical protein GF339_05865 [candidate division KSB3 bacterium]|uniref:Uncharacterized protein n=1 Tax=candidate division KSB3 bacterium TaxID=2044937 RepID=A0A9D5Q509_9BACT|nr:hypothetical protein [candidate division KSB3 bacterium]
MSALHQTDDYQREHAGKLLAKRLHQARQKKGYLVCPACHTTFDGTHVIKCPTCRTLIDTTFRELRRRKPSQKMETDFFTERPE